jgi:site-specific recombinase
MEFERFFMFERVFAKHLTTPDAVTLVTDIVDEIRPPKPHQTDAAVKAIQALCYLLNSQPEKKQQLRDAVLTLLSQHHPISLYLIARDSIFTGFFTEMRRRVSHKLLPQAVDARYLLDLFAQFFSKGSDEVWVSAVPAEVWQQLIMAMRFDEASLAVADACQSHLFSASQVLSYRITALGLEPELLRNHPELERYTSPFIAQQAELTQFLNGLEQAQETQLADVQHIFVMLDQCNAVIQKIHRNSLQVGTSIRLTQIMLQMSKQIERLMLLLQIIRYLQGKPAETPEEAPLNIVKLFKALVYSECHKNDVTEHWQDNMQVMALRVTENASRAGEHYITESRRDYFALMRSAMGAGAVIAAMAAIKIMLAGKHYAPLTEAILFSLNYGLGFIFIHLLHFTVATKQPAMTAAAIAASIDAADSHASAVANLVAMVANTMRSQMVAIFGNVVLAIPVAMGIAWAFLQLTGQHFVSVEKAQYLLETVDPFYSGALIYAAIAGVCLFLSGLIAGYHDNLAVYNKIPQRLRALPWLQKLLGKSLLLTISTYIENNLGALAGNFYFGCLLGGMTAIGVLFGLPFDIRHIAFSSAFMGFASVGLDFAISWQTALYVALGLMLIGLVNLGMSFSLALYVAMKSRKVRFQQGRQLLKALGSRLNQHPGEFILPPKNQVNPMVSSHD